MSLRQTIAEMHYRPLPVWATLLTPLEWGYRVLVESRHALYRFGLLKSVRVPVPVISVGNLTTGGTGKTPIVLELARGLMLVGKRVVILSRGYGATQPLDYGQPTGPQNGEEAFMLQQQLPDVTVVVGRDRAANAKRAVAEFNPDFIVLDDGFQYRRLDRDLDIVLVDGERGLGNAHMLPLGPLREPQETLKRADMVFITKQVSAERMQDIEARMAACGRREAVVMPVAFQVRGIYSPQTSRTEPASSLHGVPVVALSGIAQPERFEADLREAGLTIASQARYTDHHVYTKTDLAAIYANVPERGVVITTDKDWVKMRDALGPSDIARTYILKVSPALDGEWFYREFMSQMFSGAYADKAHAPSSSGFL